MDSYTVDLVSVCDRVEITEIHTAFLDRRLHLWQFQRFSPSFSSRQQTSSRWTN